MHTVSLLVPPQSILDVPAASRCVVSLTVFDATVLILIGSKWCRLLEEPVPPHTRLSDDAFTTLQQLRFNLRALLATFRQAVVPLSYLDFDTAAKVVPALYRLSHTLLADASRLVRLVHEQEVASDLLTWRSPEQWCMVASFVVLVAAWMAAMNRRPRDSLDFRLKVT